MTYSIEIFKTGTHTASNGVTRTYGIDDLQEVAETYNPDHFKAPLIFNYFAEDPHSTLGYDDREISKSPFAFGFPDRVEAKGDRLVAHFDKISPEFVQWNRDGNILAVSASLYPENFPGNPYPGKLALRHIAALGSEPPAVKGMSPLSLSELSHSESSEKLAENWALDLSEFSESAIEESEKLLDYAQIETDYSWQTLRNLFQRLREKLIDDKGIEEADKIYPQFMIDALIPAESSDEDDEDDDEDEEDEDMDDEEQDDDDELDQEVLQRVNILASQIDNVNDKISGIYQLILGMKSQFVPGYSDVPARNPIASSTMNSITLSSQSLHNQTIENTTEEPIDMSEENQVITQESQAPHPELEALRLRVQQLEAENAMKDRAARVKDIASFVERLSSSDERKVLPSDVQNQISFMVSLMDTQSAKFNYSEAGNEVEVTPLEGYKRMLESRKPLWDNSLLPTEPQDAPMQYSEKEIAMKARAYQKKMKESGKDMNYADCIDAVMKGEDK